MAFVNDIIINLSKGTAGLKQKSFRPLMLGSGVAQIAVGIYNDLAGLVSGGYATSDPEYKMASSMLAQTPSPTDFAVARKASATAYDAELTTITANFTDFWGVLIDSKLEADLNLAGTWADGNKKYFFGEIDDVTAGNGRNVDREAYVIHDVAAEWAAAAWVGQNIPKQPGSFTWKWKRLSGVSAVSYDSTDMATIRSNNTQALQEQAGAIYMNEGISTSGEYIDTMHGIDWLDDQLKKELLLFMLKNEKVPFDDTGIQSLGTVVRGVLQRAGEVGFFARAVSEADMVNSDDGFWQFRLEIPQRADLAPTDIANRDLKGIKFTAWLAGAFHKATITGLITV